MTNEPKFCRDCKHYSTDGRWQECSHIQVRNRVSGNPGFADIQRAYSTSACGTEGRLWEPKSVALPAPEPPANEPIKGLPAPRKRARWWKFWK